MSDPFLQSDDYIDRMRSEAEARRYTVKCNRCGTEIEYDTLFDTGKAYCSRCLRSINVDTSLISTHRHVDDAKEWWSIIYAGIFRGGLAITVPLGLMASLCVAPFVLLCALIFPPLGGLVWILGVYFLYRKFREKFYDWYFWDCENITHRRLADAGIIVPNLVLSGFLIYWGSDMFPLGIILALPFLVSLLMFYLTNWHAIPITSTPTPIPMTNIQERVIAVLTRCYRDVYNEACKQNNAHQLIVRHEITMDTSLVNALHMEEIETIDILDLFYNLAKEFDFDYTFAEASNLEDSGTLTTVRDVVREVEAKLQSRNT